MVASEAPRVLRIGRHRLRGGAGGKAIGLRWLQRNGYRIPDTWVILPTDASPGVKRWASALAGIVKPGQRYAVRSSADVEDGTESSFAGQFDSVLDVSGLEDVIDAVLLVVRGAESESAEAYAAARAGAGFAPCEWPCWFRRWFEPTMAGVAFSANPVTGFTEVIIEAVKWARGRDWSSTARRPNAGFARAGAWRAVPGGAVSPRPHRRAARR